AVGADGPELQDVAEQAAVEDGSGEGVAAVAQVLGKRVQVRPERIPERVPETDRVRRCLRGSVAVHEKLCFARGERIIMEDVLDRLRDQRVPALLPDDVEELRERVSVSVSAKPPRHESLQIVQTAELPVDLFQQT